MPKKSCNAFYFFMQNYKIEQSKKGIIYANMGEVSAAAGPVWQNLPPSAKLKFEEIAKREKQKNNVPEKKYTSQGVSLADIDQEQREIREAAEREEKDIKNIIKTRAFNTRNILDFDMYLMDVNWFCKVTNGGYAVGECTLLRFNLLNGVMETYHEMINPGRVPLGYASDIKFSCEELGLEMPDESKPATSNIKVLATIMDYFKKNGNDKKNLPPIFTMPDKVAPVTNFIEQLCYTVEDPEIFRIYKLDTLFFTLINAIRNDTNEGFPKQSLALVQLKQDNFKYTPGLGCEHHERQDKSFQCTMSRVKRWAFTILDSCCPLVDVQLEPGRHLPADFDVEGIVNFKMEKKRRAASSAASVSSGVSRANTPWNSAHSFNAPGSHVSEAGSYSASSRADARPPPSAFRHPDPILYSNKIRTAPEMTEEEFPALTSRGRGRSIAKSLNNMKIGD